MGPGAARPAPGRARPRERPAGAGGPRGAREPRITSADGRRVRSAGAAEARPATAEAKVQGPWERGPWDQRARRTGGGNAGRRCLAAGSPTGPRGPAERAPGPVTGPGMKPSSTGGRSAAEGSTPLAPISGAPTDLEGGRESIDQRGAATRSDPLPDRGNRGRGGLTRGVRGGRAGPRREAGREPLGSMTADGCGRRGGGAWRVEGGAAGERFEEPATPPREPERSVPARWAPGPGPGPRPAPERPRRSWAPPGRSARRAPLPRRPTHRAEGRRRAGAEQGAERAQHHDRPHEAASSSARGGDATPGVRVHRGCLPRDRL